MEDWNFVMLIGLTLGLTAGIIIGISIVSISYHEMYPISKILTNQKYCQVKEYYYMDEHRNFCDKIGVIPN